MEHGFPLARLAQLVADTRARGRTGRLVARNTERFGVVHLYFVQGRLAQVHGHAATPLASIADLATWRYGVLRQDSLPNPSTTASPDPRLEAALDDALRQLQASGVVQPAPVSANSLAGRQPSPASSPFPSPAHASPPPYSPSPPPSIGSGALPPLARAQAAASGSTASSLAATKTMRTDVLTTPQWQMVALVVHQVIEGASVLIGAHMAENLLRQALSTASRSHPLLHDLEVEAGGWLKTRKDGAIAHYSTADVAEAVAAVLTTFEVRCAGLIGATRAQDVILVAAAPFRNALAQIGLDISA